MRTRSRLTVVLSIALVAPATALSAQSVALATTTRPLSVTTRTAALDDPTIVAIFDAANTWDVETSQLALKKSHNREVRRFATMMVNDHRAVRKLGRDLAHKLHVTPTPPGKDFALYKDHVSTMTTLRSARGAAFDRAYVDHEVTYHQAVIDAITSQLMPATQNAELKVLENKVAPNFQAHLAAAKQLQGSLGSK